MTALDEVPDYADPNEPANGWTRLIMFNEGIGDVIDRDDAEYVLGIITKQDAALADRDREIERLQAELAAANEAVAVRQVALEQRTADNDSLQARLKACPTVEQLREWAFRMKHNDIPDCADEAEAIANRMEALNDR